MRAVKWLLVLAIPAVWVTAARPAEKVTPEGNTVQLLLLRQKSVQEELKLSPDVVKKVMDFTNKQHAELHKARKLGKEELKAKLKELRDENKQFLDKALTPEQHKRVNQIALQVTGLFQLNRPEVAQVLNLTKAQKVKLRVLQRAARKKLAQVLDAKSPQERKELFAKLRAETRKKIRAILTKAQKDQVKEIVGKRFTGDIVIETPESAPPDGKSDK
jgi:hypothetical protein